MKPFLKWVGGKAQLIPEISQLIPTTPIKYIESFVGGGAMLFHVLENFPNACEIVINDINLNLITTYRAIKSDAETVSRQLNRLEMEYKGATSRNEYYLQKRDQFNQEQSEYIKAALFIFLNKTCFNGLYRVNKKGEFNVPHGSYANPKICDRVNLLVVFEALQKVTICQGDFEETIKFGGKNTLFYLDPPYHPVKENSFVSYSQQKFGDGDQERVKRFCDAIDAIGGHFILSNSETGFLQDLYSGYRILKVKARRNVNRNGDGRGLVNELLVTNLG